MVAAAQLLRRGAEVTLLEPAVELGWECATCSFAPRSLYGEYNDPYWMRRCGGDPESSGTYAGAR